MSTASELVSRETRAARLSRGEAEVIRMPEAPDRTEGDDRPVTDGAARSETPVAPRTAGAPSRVAERGDDAGARERDGTSGAERTRTRRRHLPAPEPPQVLLVGAVHRPRQGTEVRRAWVQEAAERVFNVGLAAFSLAVAAPLMALIAIAIKLDSPGPVFYRQERVGRNRDEGRTPGEDGGEASELETFTLYKFRSMRSDAESDTGPVWSGDGDGRITRVGRWIRSTHLDELPQLWNVLLGDMNVVGPRPERPSFVGYLSGEIPRYTHRLRVRPGITGLAQIRQGSDGSLGDVRRKLNHDLEYIRRKSIRLDLRILLGTPRAVLRRARTAVA